MVIKKFIGKTEEAATEDAKKELGENLVIMHVRKVKAKGAFAFLRAKQVEVTAAVEDDDPLKAIRQLADRQQQSEKSGSREAILNAAREESRNQSPSGKTIEEKIDSLQSMLENQFQRENSLLKSSENQAKVLDQVTGEKEQEVEENAEEKTEKEKEMDRFLQLLHDTMIENEVDEKLADEILQEAEKGRVPNATMDSILSLIYQKMVLKFGRSQGIMPAEQGCKVIFFIGPTGVGKTTTIAKVASSFSISEKKKVALLTTDTYRIAATDQLRTYASILGVPFRVIYTEEELAAATRDFKDCDFIFVDTAGHSHKNEELLEKQKRFLQVVDDMETQCFLVLSATTKYKDLKGIVDKYRSVAKYQLIFTKLDETGNFGNLLNMKIYADCPIAYLTVGQNVPDDIEVFNAQKIVKQLLSAE